MARHALIPDLLPKCEGACVRCQVSPVVVIVMTALDTDQEHCGGPEHGWPSQPQAPQAKPSSLAGEGRTCLLLFLEYSLANVLDLESTEGPRHAPPRTSKSACPGGSPHRLRTTMVFSSSVTRGPPRPHRPAWLLWGTRGCEGKGKGPWPAVMLGVVHLRNDSGLHSSPTAAPGSSLRVAEANSWLLVPEGSTGHGRPHTGLHHASAGHKWVGITCPQLPTGSKGLSPPEGTCQPV